jgi:hypothetical protein
MQMACKCIIILIIWLQTYVVDCRLRFQGFVPVSCVVAYVSIDGDVIAINCKYYVLAGMPSNILQALYLYCEEICL